MGDPGKPHRRLPRLGEFRRVARTGRTVFRVPARGRTHQGGADLGSLTAIGRAAYAAVASAETPSALKWSIMTFATAIKGRASARPQIPNTAPSRIWNANSVAGGMSSA